MRLFLKILAALCVVLAGIAVWAQSYILAVIWLLTAAIFRIEFVIDLLLEKEEKDNKQ